MEPAQIQVLYIAGADRSGSTLLNVMLGQVSGLVSVGEARLLWERGLLEDRRCGCGVNFHRCPFWSEVLKRAVGGSGAIDARALVRASRRTGTRHLPLMALPGSQRLFARRLKPYLSVLESLYRSIAETSGGAVIVDSSKSPAYALLLQLIPSLDVRVVHLVRDPRAVAYSWRRPKLFADTVVPTPMPLRGALETALFWTAWNLALPPLCRRYGARTCLVRYEDLVARPRGTLRKILRLVDREASPLPFASDSAFEIATTHTVSGNPVRFDTGVVELKLDDAWRTGLSRRDRLIASAATWPLRLRYGYS